MTTDATRFATRPEDRARELANIARAEVVIAAEIATREHQRAIDAAIHDYEHAILAATGQHAIRIEIRGRVDSRNPIQRHHDRKWAEALYYAAARRVTAAVEAAEDHYRNETTS